MNDTNYMDNNGNDVDIDVLVEQQTPVGGVSSTNRLSVVDTLLVYKIIFIVMGVIFLITLCFGDIKANATENSVYVDSAYMQEQFGSYPYYLIVTDESGNYMTLYSSAQICYNGTVFRAFCTNHYYGYKTMKVVDDYLVIDENGTSYDKWSSISVSFNSNGLPSTYKTIVYASKDIYNTGTSNTGSPIVGTTVIYSVANNIGAKPADDSGTVAPDINIDVDLTEVLSYLDELNIKTDDILVYLSEISLALKSIFTMFSICVFFLIADWTSNKIKNITRRFSNYE